MHIRGVTAHHIRIPFKTTFAHALQSRTCAEAVIVIAESDAGVCGAGEIVPRPYVTGETISDVCGELLPVLVSRWAGRNFGTRDEVVKALRAELDMPGRALATLAGWELAVLDVAGQTFGFQAGDVLGPAAGRDLEPGVVLDFSVTTENLEKRSAMLRLAGIRHVKVKVGLPSDLERVGIVRRIMSDAVLRLDANGAWTADKAVRMLRCMDSLHIDGVEQPVPADDLCGMRTVREKTGVRVIADESVCSLGDAQRALAERAADGFNIRLGKCGGLLGAHAVASFATENGLARYLGTLVGETGILSRAAEIFGSRVPGFEFLEGKRQNKSLLADDIVEPRTPASSPGLGGLGLEILRVRLSRWTVQEPFVFAAEGAPLGYR